ncbi:MAG: serine hydrolase [Gemmatimonadota bacterium]
MDRRGIELQWDRHGDGEPTIDQITKALRGLTLRRIGAVGIVALAACSSPQTPGDGDSSQATLASELPLGHPDSVLFWTPEQQRAGFPNYDLLFGTRSVPASTNPRPMPRSAGDELAVTVSVDGGAFDVDDFVRANEMAGLIVVHRDTVLLERYSMDHGPDDVWVSYSVAKSVVSLLYGAAIADGYIASIDDNAADYLPLLRGSTYDGVRLRDLLQMASGVEWNEDYTDPTADVSQEIGLSNLARIDFIKDKPRAAPPGTEFNYSTGETHLAGAVLRGAIGNNLASYLHQKVWEPFGMESDANWRLVEDSGPEHGGCCVSATLRDYARIGLFALHEGRGSDGMSRLPDGWMAESTTPSAPNDGYGYLWWLSPDGSYSAYGIFGQLIHIDPSRELVIATHGLWPVPVDSERSRRRAAFLEGVKAAVDAR